MYTDWLFKMKENEAQTTLEERVVELLAEHKMTVTTAESCTGGLIAATLVNVPGASDVLNEGYITYSNEAKIRLVNVSPETLERYGAVSSQTAKEMANGAAKAAKAEAALSATGIAGPGGGTPDKPVGLVYFGCYYNGEVSCEKHIFKGDRYEVRTQAADKILEIALNKMTLKN